MISKPRKTGAAVSLVNISHQRIDTESVKIHNPSSRASDPRERTSLNSIERRLYTCGRSMVDPSVIGSIPTIDKTLYFIDLELRKKAKRYVNPFSLAFYEFDSITNTMKRAFYKTHDPHLWPEMPLTLMEKAINQEFGRKLSEAKDLFSLAAGLGIDFREVRKEGLRGPSVHFKIAHPIADKSLRLISNVDTMLAVIDALVKIDPLAYGDLASERTGHIEEVGKLLEWAVHIRKWACAETYSNNIMKATMKSFPDFVNSGTPLYSKPSQ